MLSVALLTFVQPRNPKSISTAQASHARFAIKDLTLTFNALADWQPIGKSSPRETTRSVEPSSRITIPYRTDPCGARTCHVHSWGAQTLAFRSMLPMVTAPLCTTMLLELWP